MRYSRKIHDLMGLVNPESIGFYDQWIGYECYSITVKGVKKRLVSKVPKWPNSGINQITYYPSVLV